MASRDNPLVNTHDFYSQANTANRSNLSKTMFDGPPMKAEEKQKQQQEMVKQVREKIPPRNTYQGGYNPQPTQTKGNAPSSVVIQNTQPAPKFQTILVERFREKLKARGGRGMIGLRRQFKIMDDNNSGTLDMYEFKKGIKDF